MRAAEVQRLLEPRVDDPDVVLAVGVHRLDIRVVPSSWPTRGEASAAGAEMVTVRAKFEPDW